MITPAVLVRTATAEQIDRALAWVSTPGPERLLIAVEGGLGAWGLRDGDLVELTDGPRWVLGLVVGDRLQIRAIGSRT